MLKVEFDMTAVNTQLADFQAKVAAALRPAAQAGAQVLYAEVRAQAPRSEKAHFTRGKKHAYQPGNLRRSIYQAYNETDSVPGKRQGYAISWNKTKAFYGRFVEFGTSKMPAHSFLRKSYETKKAQAMLAAKAKFAEKMKS